MCDHRQLRSPAPVGVVDHVGSLSESFGELVENSDYSDITLIVDGGQFQGHKVILAARSEYFRALFYGGLKESQPGISQIELHDVPAAAFSSLFKYIYTGRLHLTEIKEESHILDVLGLAHRFGFEELETAISDYLKSVLNNRNVCPIYDLANMYNLTSLCTMCQEFIDRNAFEILHSESFLSLSQNSVKELIARDSFYAHELDIFKSVCEWAEFNNGLDPTPILDSVRLPLMTMTDLLNNVRPTSLVPADCILDAIKTQTESRAMDLKYRGLLIPEENIATALHGAHVYRGEMKSGLLDGDYHNYDLDRGFSRHPIDDNNGQGIVIKLDRPYILNMFKLLLWDRDMRSYSYYIEVSMDDKDYIRVIDHTGYLCRSWQKLYFPTRVCKYIRIVGTHNTVNRVFHLVALEAYYTNKSFILDRGLVVPTENVATIKNSAVVIEGVSRSRNALINGDVKNYDWDSGYTCHQLGSGAIVIQLAQPYVISSMRLLLWDCDDRSYSFYIEVSVDHQTWTMVADKQREFCKAWQLIEFDPIPVAFIRIVGTHNTANEVFHCVHFECPADLNGVNPAASHRAPGSPSHPVAASVSQQPESSASGNLGNQGGQGNQMPRVQGIDMYQPNDFQQDTPEADRIDTV
ncbi:hypothetical protein SNE40_008833 [Patella caerulea]|uniref:BTB/POZ domain-containing protein 9 n=1 Tax=Patella caerulea TaxID=87958 RepID=A0AAN8JMP5_PATCE